VGLLQLDAFALAVLRGFLAALFAPLPRFLVGADGFFLGLFAPDRFGAAFFTRALAEVAGFAARFGPDEGADLGALAARPAIAPITPPTTAPNGPPKLPSTAPAAAPATGLEMGGISMLSDDDVGDGSGDD